MINIETILYMILASFVVCGILDVFFDIQAGRVRTLVTSLASIGVMVYFEGGIVL